MAGQWPRASQPVPPRLLPLVLSHLTLLDRVAVSVVDIPLHGDIKCAYPITTHFTLQYGASCDSMSAAMGCSGEGACDGGGWDSLFSR